MYSLVLSERERGAAAGDARGWGGALARASDARRRARPAGADVNPAPRGGGFVLAFVAMPSPAPALQTFATTLTRVRTPAERAQTVAAGLGSVRRPARLRVRSLCGADGAYVLEDRAGTRSFAFPGTYGVWWTAKRSPAGGELDHARPVGTGPSRDDLLKADVAARAGDHDELLLVAPRHDAGDQRMAGERAVAGPDMRLQRVAKLIARRPALYVDELAGLATQPAGSLPSGHHGRRGPRTGPLRSSRRAVRARPTPPGAPAPHAPARASPYGCATPRDRWVCGSARRGGPCTPGIAARASPVHVQPGQRDHPASAAALARVVAAPRAGRGAGLLGAPLLEPRLVVAHDDLPRRESAVLVTVLVTVFRSRPTSAGPRWRTPSAPRL